mgnify:CR=1 FL=1
MEGAGGTVGCCTTGTTGGLAGVVVLEAGGRGRAAGAVLESSVGGIGPSEKKIVISFLVNADFHCIPSVKKDLLR